MPDHRDKLKKLHQNLVKDGYELPEYSVFELDMGDYSKRKKLHENLINEGYDIPDFETFSGDMGFHLKKNSAGAAGSLIGGIAGSSAGQFVKSNKDRLRDYLISLREPQNKIDLARPIRDQRPVTIKKSFRKNNEFLLPVDQETDQEARSKVFEIMLGDDDQWRDPLKSLAARANNATTTKDRTVYNHSLGLSLNSLAPDGFDALRILNDSHLGYAGEDNETARALRARADKYVKETEPLRSLPFNDVSSADQGWLSYNAMPYLRSAALKWYASENKNFGDQLTATGIDPDEVGVENKIGTGKMGLIMEEFLRSPNIEAFLSKENPGLKRALDYARDANITEHRDYGINQVANEVSREIQRSGYNAIEPIFNYWGSNSKEYADLVAQKLYRDQPEKLRIWKEYVKDKQDELIDAPSFAGGFAEGAKSMFQGSINTFAAPFRSTAETIKRKWQQEAEHVSANPSGLMKFLNDVGHATGVVASIGAGSNLFGAAGIANPKTASALATTTAFLGDTFEESRMKFPDSPVKQWTSAILNTGLYAALSYDLFPADKVMAAVKDAKPAINRIVENLSSGAITRDAARKEASTLFSKVVEFTGEGLATNTKIAAEMTAITSFNRTLDKALGMDAQTFGQYHPDDEEAETFKAMFLSNSLVAGMSAAGKIRQRNRVAEESLYEAASNPKFYGRLITELAVKNPEAKEKELADNLNYLVGLKKSLDLLQMEPQLQKKYLFQSLSRNVAEQRLAETKEPVLRVQLKDEIEMTTAEKKAIFQEHSKPKKKETLVDFASTEMAQAARKPKMGRIPVEPVSGQKPMNLSDILEDVTRGLGQKLFFAKPDASRAAGTYSPGSTAIKLRRSNDLDTAAHEIAHGIDDKFGFTRQASQEVKNELLLFAPHGSKPPRGHPDPKSYTLAEGVAEFVRALVVNPTETRRVAPKAFEFYEKLIPAEVREVINRFSLNVRNLAGASGKDIILANIEMQPQKEGTIQKMLGELKRDDGFSITWADRLAANFLNPLRAFDKAFQFARGLKGVDQVLPENDPTVLARLMFGYEGKYGEILKTGMIDSRHNLILDQHGNAKNLNWLLEPLKDATPEGVQENMSEVVAYMVAERTVELAGKFDRGDLLTGIGAGLYSDVSVAISALKQFDNLPQVKRDQITEAANRYRMLANDVLKYLVDKGRMSEVQYEKILADNVQYVALNRILESEPNQEIEVYHEKKRSLGSSRTPVHEIKGSARKIQNPYISLLDTIYKAVREADRNEVLKNFRDMLVEDRMMGEGEPEPLAEIGVRVKEGTKNSIPVFVNGKRELWQFQQDVYEALKGFDSDGWRFHPFMTAHARVLRWSVTHWPVFAARNWVRDFQDRLIKSNDNAGFNGFTNIMGKKEDWASLARSGGLNAGYYMRSREHYYGLMKEGMKELAGNGNIIADALDLKKVWGKYEDLLFSGETSNRVAEYRSAFQAAKKRGMDDYNASLYAADKARGLIDFAVMGHYMKLINQIVPFSNAAVQGLRSSFIRAKENPKAFAIRMALLTVIPQVAVWMLNHRDEDTALEYENLPAWQRDGFWNFKIGPNKWLAIPKPFELALPSAGTDRLMSYLQGDENAFRGYGGTVARSFIPVDEGALAGPFAPFVEAMTNYDLWRGKPIVPPHEVSLNLALRNNESSSQLGLMLQKFFKVDARKIDHIIKSQFSYFGDASLKLSNSGEEGEKAQFSITDLGFFKNSPGYNAEVVQQFLETAREWQLTGTRPYRYFSGLVDEYFQAETDSEKERLGALLIETAKMLQEDIERTMIQDNRIKRHELKKEFGH